MKMTSRFALVAAAATLLGAYSANAADLGGGCCADLEERVAELEATTARKGNRVVSLQVYGQVGRGILSYDLTDAHVKFKKDEKGDLVRDQDGKKIRVIKKESTSDTKLINEDGSNFGFTGSATIRPGLTAGYKIELDVVDEQAAPPEVKQNNVWIESEQLGRVTLGQQSVATDGIAHIILANTYSDSGNFQNDIYNLANAGYGDFDGGRGDALRYDSPSVGGFILSASWSDNLDESNDDFDPAHEHNGSTNTTDFWDVTLRYSGEFNAFRIAAGVGYSEEDVLGNGRFGHNHISFTNEILQGSASVMHVPTGLFAAFSAGSKDTVDLSDNKAETAEYWYTTGGIEKTWLSYGATTVYAEYGEYSDGGIAINGVDKGFKNGDDTMWGAGLVQKFDAAALDLYFQYRHVEEDSAVSDELDTAVLGAVIKF